MNELTIKREIKVNASNGQLYILIPQNVGFRSGDEVIISKVMA